MRIIVIGGGAAGMMAAVSAAEEGAEAPGEDAPAPVPEEIVVAPGEDPMAAFYGARADGDETEEDPETELPIAEGEARWEPGERVAGRDVEPGAYARRTARTGTGVMWNTGRPHSGS